MFLLLLIAAALGALLGGLADPVQAHHLCGNTGSPAGPFQMQTYEAADYRSAYAHTMELAGYNQLFPEHPSFALPNMETGDRSAGSSQVIPGYIPPVILKAVAWMESRWAQGDYDVPYGQVGSTLVSHDCGYGVMQVTSGMQNVTGVPNLEQAMIGGHYAFNIARGAHLLADKWNLGPEFRPIIGNRDPHVAEEWYYALWSYNGFAFRNHPLNPAYDANRPPFSCGPEGDGMGHDRSKYPYQELVLGCAAHPPVKNGVQLWDPVEVHLPDRNNPLFAGPLSVANWEPCAFQLNCAPMDMVPVNYHQDPATPPLAREAIFGAPTLASSPTSLSFDALPGGESFSSSVAVVNAGGGILAWRALSPAPWLKVDRYQGVSLGPEMGGVNQELSVHASASGLGPGTYHADIIIDSLFAWGTPLKVPVTLTVSLQAGATGAGDFTGDGKTDTIFLCCSDYASMWASQGNGNFARTTFRPWPEYGMTVGSWQLGYFNADSRLDLLHICCEGTANVWFSNGDGTFDVRAFNPGSGYGMQLGSWLTGDFNGDLRTDLLHIWGTDSANVWLNAPDGGFTIIPFQSWPGYGMTLGSWQTGDFDGDGKTDLMHIWGGDTVNIWRSDGKGGFSLSGFQPWPGYGTSSGFWRTGDFNGDHQTDLIHLWGQHEANMWWSLGNGSFSVLPASPWPGYGMQTGSWWPIDVNGDGLTDLVHLCCGSSANVWLFTGGGNFVLVSYEPWPQYNLGLGFWQPGDYDGDGKADLLHVCCHYANLWRSTADGRFQLEVYVP